MMTLLTLETMVALILITGQSVVLSFRTQKRESAREITLGIYKGSKHLQHSGSLSCKPGACLKTSA